MTKTTRRLQVAILALTLSFGITAHAQDDNEDWREVQDSARSHDWVQIREDKLRNIRIFSKLEENSRIRSMRADAELAVPPEKIIRTLMDFPGYAEWLWNLKDIRMLRQVSANEFFIHCTFQTPGGFPDRDVVLKVDIQTTADKRQTVIQGVNSPEFLTPVKGVVRIPDMKLTIRIEEAGDRKSRFSSELRVDPGGQVPLWAANFVQRRAPYATMLGLIRRLER